jgi:hypothetical protein
MDKWIPGVSPDDRTSDVAGRTLRFRLAAVQHYLPLAARDYDVLAQRLSDGHSDAEAQAAEFKTNRLFAGRDAGAFPAGSCGRVR